MPDVIDKACPHCYLMEAMGLHHTKNCGCGHHHADHNFAGGCRIPGCKCDRYDQSERYKTRKDDVPEQSTDIDLHALAACIMPNETSEELKAAQARLEILRDKVAELGVNHGALGST